MEESSLSSLFDPSQSTPKIDESLLMSPKGAAAFSSGKSVPKKYHRVGTSGLSVEVVSGENKVSFELSSKE